MIVSKICADYMTEMDGGVAQATIHALQQQQQSAIWNVVKRVF